jgi:hypothetical protein
MSESGSGQGRANSGVIILFLGKSAESIFGTWAPVISPSQIFKNFKILYFYVSKNYGVKSIKGYI